MSAPLPTNDSRMPLGHAGSRGEVLLQLKRAQPLAVKQLAARMGLSLNAARHHLKELEAQGLVQYQLAHHGVGAPAYAYRLTSTGEALFHRRYEETLTALLDSLVEQEGREAAISLLESHLSALARRLREDLKDSTPAQRLQAVAQVRSEQGYMAEAAGSDVDGTLVGGTLTEHNCAIQAVAERFPEICAAEARFLSEVLGAEVERREHILSGCSACEYHVRFKPEHEI